MSSEDETISSPVRRQEPASSPKSGASSVRDPSSPVPASSPLRNSSSDNWSTDEEYEQPHRKRFSEPGVSCHDTFWPAENNPASSPSRDDDEELHIQSDDNMQNSGDFNLSHSSSETSLVSSSTSGEESSDTSSEADDSSESEVNDEHDHNSPSSSDNGSESDNSDSSSDESDSISVWEGSELTVDEGVLSIMEIFINQRVQKTTIAAFLKTLLKFLPESHNMPRTPYLLFKYVTDLCPLPKEIIHFYCSKCHFYLGNSAKKCTSCGCDTSCRFFQFSLESQLRNLFQNHNLADYIDKYTLERNSRSQEGTFMDICDGSEYKRIHIPGQYNLTVIGHTDGVSITESSKVSVWPLEYVIAEVSPKVRFQFILVNGVWLDETKPNFNLYFKPFADELAHLNGDGFTWIHPKTKVQHTSRVALSCFVVDGPVRAQVQNILCIGGRHSCNTCEQKMLKLPREPVQPGVQKKKRKRIFAFSENESTIRSKSRMSAQGQITLQRKVAANGGKFVAKKGVLGVSVVSQVPNFDRSTGVFPEYMHLVLGIVKQFMELWFESPLTSPYSLGRHRDEINSLLLSIRVPDYVTRIPRSTDSYSNWKANELRSFLLYYSVPLLSPFMKEGYLNHWMLFVSSMEILLRDKISENDRSNAKTMLRLFIRNLAALYKSEVLTYNLHSLLHVSLTVKRWGNLQYISAYPFEGFNGGLANCIHGSKNQGQELANNVRIMCGVGVLKARNSTFANPNSISLKLHNQIRTYCITAAEQEIFNKFGKSADSFYYRAELNHEVYTSSIYFRQKKRNNFTIYFKSNNGKHMYGTVKCFVKCKDGDFMALVNCFVVDNSRYFIIDDTRVVLRHIVPISETNDVTLVRLVDIVSKVIRVGSFVCLRPNKYEVNL